MNLFEFFYEKAVEKGTPICENCGATDKYYTLYNDCVHCGQVLPKVPKEKKLQFALEIIVEFIEKYDESLPENSKKTFLQICKATVYKIKTQNKVENSQLIHIQHLCKHMPTIGSNSFGGALDMEKNGIQVLSGIDNPDETQILLSTIGAALIFVRDYEVSNEYIIDTKPSTNKPQSTAPAQQEKSYVPKTNKGCLSIFFLLIIILIFLISFFTIS